MRTVLLIIGLMLLLSACNESEDYVYSDDSAYHPMQAGMVWIDSVTQITIDDPSGVYDTLYWVEKTVVDSLQTNDELQRFYCTNYLFDTSASRWIIDHIFWYEKSKNALLKFEQNNIWLELVFPLYKNTSWNYYAYSTLADTAIRSSVYEVDQLNNILGNIYDSTLVVHHHMDSTLIYKYTDQSFYVRNIGFLYREKVSIISDDPDYDYTLPIEERIKTASILKKRRYYGQPQ